MLLTREGEVVEALIRRPARLAVLTGLALVAAMLPAATAGSAPSAPAQEAPEVEPCGEGDASGATDVGVTDTSITIATIQDVGGDLRPGLREDNQQAMEAFVRYCNKQGGINGRKLELNKYDSALLEALDAYEQACAEDNFAIVGEGVIFDDAGLEVIEECGIPTIPAFSTSPARQLSELTYEPAPSPPDRIFTGRFEWLKEEFPGVEERAAMLCPSTTITQYSCDRQVFAAEEAGFEFVYQGETEINVANWGPFVDQLRQNDVTYLGMVADETNWAGLQRELHAQGLDIEVVDSGAGIYSEEYLDQAGPAADDTLVSLGVTPLDEAKRVRELRRYTRWVERVDGEPSALGIMGWSAGLLFATAVQSLGSDVTRAGLVTALQNIHEWDANGLHAVADPGGKEPTGCFAQLQVNDGEFERIFPKRGFECRPNDIVDVPEELQS
ncbi:MAG: ABC transporter substrate-binding protein [Acidimicrobiia bacterium]